MGSFNVGCGISHLTIHEGDEAGFILITEKEKYRTREVELPETRAMHLYSTDLYDPYLPPVYGVYNDYGGMVDLKESATTEAIETIFRRPALAVINAVGQDRGIYSTYGSIGALYMPEAVLKTLGDYNATDGQKFAALGFEEIAPPEGFTVAHRYGDYELHGTPMQNSSLPPDMIRLEWQIFRTTDGENLGGRLHAFNGLEEVFSNFAALTDLLPGFEEADWRAVKQLQKMNGMWFLKDVYQGLSGPVQAQEWDENRLTRWEEDFTKAMEELEAGALYSMYLSDLQRTVGLRGHAWRALRPLIGTGEFSEIPKFLGVMSAVNSMLMPSFNGEQFGNDAASLILAQSTMGILMKREIDREEY